LTAAFVSTRGAVSVTTPSSTWQISPNGATAINNTLFVAVRAGAGWVSGVTDTQGNVWHTALQSGGGSVQVALAHTYLTAPLNTWDTITVTLSSSTTGAAELLEFSGMAGWALQDAPVASNPWATGTSLTVNGAAATTGANEMVITVAGTAASTGSTVAWTAPSGFTVEPTGLTPGNVVNTAWKLTTTTGTSVSATWGQGTSTAIAGLICAFRPQANVTTPTRILPPAGVYRGPCGIWKQNGAYPATGGQRQGVAAYEAWLGRRVSYVLDYVTDSPTSTAAFTTATLDESVTGYTTLNGWGTLPSRWTMMLALPACIGRSAGSGATTWAQEASGASDAYWTALGTNLVSWGYGNAVLRIGREFNGNWYPWAPIVSGDSIAQYVAGYQHVVTKLRSVAGSSFQFCWNPTLGTMSGQTGGNAEVLNWYPGDAYVDSIGIDTYDWSTYPTQTASPYGYRTSNQQQYNWTTQETQQDGVNTYLSFAQQRGKPFGIPEWGLQQWLSGGNYIGGGDDPTYVTELADVASGAFMQAMWEDHGVGLFDTDTDTRRVPSLQSPDVSRALYLQLLGGGLADLGGATDRLAVHAAVHVTDLAGAAETVTHVLPADLGAATDTISYQVSVSLTDTAAAVEATSGGGPPSPLPTDQGAGTDALTWTSASNISLTDQAGATDGLGVTSGKPPPSGIYSDIYGDQYGYVAPGESAWASPASPAFIVSQMPRMHCQNLITGAWYHRDVQGVTSPTVTWTLNAPGTFTCTLAPPRPDMLDATGNPLLQEWRDAIYLEESGSIKFGGIVTASTMTGPAWTITATEFTAYPPGMIYEGANYSVTNIDALDAVRYIWAYLQAQPGGNLGLQLSAQKAGVLLGAQVAAGVTTVLARPADAGQSVIWLGDATAFENNEHITISGLPYQIDGIVTNSQNVPTGQVYLWQNLSEHHGLGEPVTQVSPLTTPTVAQTNPASATKLSRRAASGQAIIWLADASLFSSGEHITVGGTAYQINVVSTAKGAATGQVSLRKNLTETHEIGAAVVQVSGISGPGAAKAGQKNVTLRDSGAFSSGMAVQIGSRQYVIDTVAGPTAGGGVCTFTTNLLDDVPPGTTVTQIEVVTPYTLDWYNSTDLGQEIASIQQEAVFDFTETHTWTDATKQAVSHQLSFGVPRIGTRLTGLRFCEGENIIQAATVTRDGTVFADNVVGLGAGTGSASVRATAANASTGRLRRTYVYTDQTVQTVSRLTAKVQKVLASMQNIDTVTQVVVKNHANAPFGSFGPGDDIPVMLASGWRNTTIWSRITAMAQDPTSDLMTLTLARSDSFTYLAETGEAGTE